jgi:hypothetical protein
VPLPEPEGSKNTGTANAVERHEECACYFTPLPCTYLTSMDTCSRRARDWFFWSLALPVCGLAGCGFSGPARVMPPNVDPNSAAAEAISLYDSDADGRLSESELSASPALYQARERYDTDGDRSVSESEIAARFEQLYNRPVGFTGVSCTVTRGGVPLPDAEVRFLPEPFLAEAIHPASGATDQRGSARPGVAAEYLPENLRHVPMMQVGLYRVEIEHPSVPTDRSRPLGFEVDPSRRDGTSATFDL